MMRLFCYKLSSDTGFAPNPFGKTLTLATCKPLIRKYKHEGDWVAGFTSQRLNNDPVREERLLYLMKVVEKIRICDYFVDKRFQNKIPDMTKKGAKAKAGDNIYKPKKKNAVVSRDFSQLKNPNHWGSCGSDLMQQEIDISGEYVLLAGEFYYFGRNAIKIPRNIRPCVPKGQSAHGVLTPAARAKKLIQYIRSQYQPGRHGDPHSWPERQRRGCSV